MNAGNFNQRTDSRVQKTRPGEVRCDCRLYLYCKKTGPNAYPQKSGNEACKLSKHCWLILSSRAAYGSERDWSKVKGRHPLESNYYHTCSDMQFTTDLYFLLIPYFSHTCRLWHSHVVRPVAKIVAISSCSHSNILFTMGP